VATTHEIAEEASATAATMTLGRAMLLLIAAAVGIATTVALVVTRAVLGWLMAVVGRAATTEERTQTAWSTGRPMLVTARVLLAIAAATT
jgi:UPF0716 family protein affecting phage T7 exclusion